MISSVAGAPALTGAFSKDQVTPTTPKISGIRTEPVYITNRENLFHKLVRLPSSPVTNIPDYDSSIPDNVVADNSVSKIWGNIEVNGKVVAQIYEKGLVASNGAFRLPDPNIEGASARAQAMLKAYGGTLVMRNEMKNPQLFYG